MPPPSQRSHKHVPKPDRRRALELLAASSNGCTETLLIAHGITIKQMVVLIHDGLASATAERVVSRRRSDDIHPG